MSCRATRCVLIIHATSLIILTFLLPNKLLPSPKPSNFLSCLVDKVWKIHKCLIYRTFFANMKACCEHESSTFKFANSVKSGRPARFLPNPLIPHTLPTTTQ